MSKPTETSPPFLYLCRPMHRPKLQKRKKKRRKKKEIFNNKIANSNQKKGPLSVNKGAAGEARPL
jgi:hypothetical protein